VKPEQTHFILCLQSLCRQHGVSLTVEPASVPGVDGTYLGVIIVHSDPDCHAPLGQACAIRFEDEVNRDDNGTVIL
jgi:hypothetical protein